MRRLLVPLLAGFLALPALAGATEPLPNPMVEVLVKFSGQMHFVEKACDLGPAHVIEGSRQEQRKMAMDTYGISGEEFDRWHRQGHDKSSQEWQAMDDGERQKSCDEIRPFYLHE